MSLALSGMLLGYGLLDLRLFIADCYVFVAHSLKDLNSSSHFIT